jgi:hypothetical protein
MFEVSDARQTDEEDEVDEDDLEEVTEQATSAPSQPHLQVQLDTARGAMLDHFMFHELSQCEKLDTAREQHFG